MTYEETELIMENINKKIKGLGFHHIALKVKDFKKSYKFYADGLGMTPIVGWGEGAGEIQMFDLGDGGILELFAGGGDDLSENGKWLHFAMRADDVDTAYAAAVAAGAKPLTAPKEVKLDSRPYKMTIKVAFVIGLDGEQLEFFKVLSKGE
jgi:glyoxylase I family protein